MRETLQRVLELQPEWTGANTPAMQERGQLVRHDGPDELRELLPDLAPLFPEGSRDLVSNGRDGTGQKTEIPWFRLAAEGLSPDARTGFYLVYLFDGEGATVALSLNQATTTFDGGQFIPLAGNTLAQRVQWAREVIAATDLDTQDLDNTIDLRARGPLGGAYEQGNIYALTYTAGALPDDAQLRADLGRLARLLAAIYQAQQRGQAPGDTPAEVDMAESAVASAAGRPRPRGPGFRPNARQRKAIEDRGMKVAREHLKGQGWEVTDVSSRKPYDLHAERTDEELHVEVKATTSDGAQVLLTHGEVAHARREHPRTALAIVTGVVLNGEVATGGDLTIHRPWLPDEADLSPIAYRYVVPD